jgi:hypothetical protein
MLAFFLFNVARAAVYVIRASMGWADPRERAAGIQFRNWGAHRLVRGHFPGSGVPFRAEPHLGRFHHSQTLAWDKLLVPRCAGFAWGYCHRLCAPLPPLPFGRFPQ